MVEKNSIMFSNVDREDGWISGALIFECDQKLNYEESYLALKDKLESKEIVDFVIDDRCLDCDLFDDDESYKFKETQYDYGLIYVFENENGDTVEYKFTQTDKVYVFRS